MPAENRLLRPLRPASQPPRLSTAIHRLPHRLSPATQHLRFC